MKNVIGWLKFNENMDNKEDKDECTCDNDPCTCSDSDEKVDEKKKVKKEDKKEDKKKDKETKGKKEYTAAQKAKLPWLKDKK